MIDLQTYLIYLLKNYFAQILRYTHNTDSWLLTIIDRLATCKNLTLTIAHNIGIILGDYVFMLFAITMGSHMEHN